MFTVSFGLFSSTQAHSPIPTKLQDALESFAGEFFCQLNRCFHALYQRSIQKDAIATQHPAWADGLRVLDEKMTRVWSEARAIYKEIPAIENPDHKKLALARMLHLETLATQMQGRCQKLMLLLNSSEHQGALKFYKEKLKQCEGFVAEDADDDVLLAILEEVKEKQKALDELDVSIKEEIALLYNEICTFLLYTAQQLGKDNLIDTINAVIDHRVLPELQLRALPHAKSVTLPTENYFRNGQWLAGWRVVGYPDIRNEFMALQEIAKELYHIECSVQECLERACISDTTFYMELKTHEGRVSDLEFLINEQLTRLTEKRLSNQVHAGWYYVAGLIAQAKSVRSAISLVGNGEFRTYAEAAHKLRDYIEGRQGSNQSMVCLDLYQAVEACQKMPVPPFGNEHVYTVITDTLKNEAQTGCMLVGFEKEIPVKVFTRSLPFHLHVQDVHSFLMKGFLHVLYFSDQVCNPELEAVLFWFEHDPIYKEEFAKCMESKTLQQLYQAYKEKSGVEKHWGVIQRITNSLASLHSAPESGQLDVRIAQFDRFVRFHKAHQLLLNLQGQAGGHPLVVWFNAQVMQFADMWQDVLALSEPIQEVPLYKHLHDSLFCSDQQLRQTADSAIVRILSAKDFTMEKGATILKVLLSRWALERFVHQSGEVDILEGLKCLVLDGKPSEEITYLTSLFNAYVRQPMWTALWRSQYGLGFMELAFFKFSKKVACFNVAREQELRSLENVLALYANFKKIINKCGCLVRDTGPYEECLKLYSKARTFVPQDPGEVVNLQIAAELCAEMYEFLYRNRVLFIK